MASISREENPKEKIQINNLFKPIEAFKGKSDEELQEVETVRWKFSTPEGRSVYHTFLLFNFFYLVLTFSYSWL